MKRRHDAFIHANVDEHLVDNNHGIIRCGNANITGNELLVADYSKAHFTRLTKSYTKLPRILNETVPMHKLLL